MDILALALSALFAIALAAAGIVWNFHKIAAIWVLYVGVASDSAHLHCLASSAQQCRTPSNFNASRSHLLPPNASN